MKLSRATHLSPPQHNQQWSSGGTDLISVREKTGRKSQLLTTDSEQKQPIHPAGNTETYPVSHELLPLSYITTITRSDHDIACLIPPRSTIMSADFSSSNPFRRKGPSSPSTSISTSTLPNHASLQPQSPSLSATSHIAYQHASLQPAFSSISSHSSDAPKKIPKKVRVQSPPPPSPSTPSLPDSASTARDEDYFLSAHPSTPPLRDPDPFDSLESASEDEDGKQARPGKAPANPFSKTLETMEHTQRNGPGIGQKTPVPSPGRASMDVEAFKRLLMTGNSGLGPSTPTAQSTSQLHVAHALGGDGGSSTDTSSLSRQSIYEAIQEPHPESPRTSNEISEPDKERREFDGNFTPPSSGKKPAPPPPSSRHGKMIRVELRDEPTAPQVLQSPPTPGSITSHQYFSSSPQTQGYLTSNSQTDLNKPLPPAPNRTSHDSERESVFDKEAAGKTPEPPSPSSSIKRKTPPAPPLTRIQAQPQWIRTTISKSRGRNT